MPIFNSGTLLLWAVLFVGPSGAHNSAYSFRTYGPLLSSSKGQHSEHLAFCFLRVSPHLLLPTPNWLGLIQGERGCDHGQQMMLL